MQINSTSSKPKMLFNQLASKVATLKFIIIILIGLMLMNLNLSAHTWEIRVKQNANGTLTWYGQSYHGVGSCGISNSGININGVNYNWSAEFSGSVVPHSAYIFTASPQYTACCNVSGRVSYGTVTTPFIPGNLTVTAYSTNACYALYPDMPAGGGVFNPPPPGCTTCPLINWNNTVGTANNNGTPCNISDDYIPVTITVNHQNCAKSTGNGQFTIVNSSTNSTIGSYVFNAISPTVITYNAPVGTSNSTQINISTTFPCNVQQPLEGIPNGTFSGIPETTPPTINCPANITVNATSAAGAVVTYVTPVGTDNCPGATTTRISGLASGATFPIGTTTVTYRVTDGRGLTAQCSFTVTVNGVAPQIVCPANITVNNTPNQCGAIVNFAATETVGVPASTITYSQNPGTFFPVGTTTVTATATNVMGTSNCSFTITVVDNDNPTITCPALVTVQCTSAVPAVDVNSVFASDNCSEVVSVTHEGDVISNQTCANRYTITRTYKATDDAGNFATCTQTITVNDDTAPNISCPAPIIINNDAGQCGANVTFNATATDNCTGAISIVYSKAPGSFFNLGTTLVTVTATDVCGNSSTCSFNVTINDTENPVITCPAPITVNISEGTCGAVVNYNAPVTTDNCALPVNNGSQVFTYTGSLQAFTVPAGVTSVNIVTRGAQGGNNGGRGAIMQGDFAVTPGAIFKVLVGEAGKTNFTVCGQHHGAGGGGGSFVTTSTNSPLIVAGGGGGSVCTPHIGIDATTSINGLNGYSPASPSLIGIGGINGNGATNNGTGRPHAGNAGGFYTAGISSLCGGPGQSFISGGNGGTSCGPNNAGGYGTAGGGGNAGGGGGGGYSGGGGSYHYPGNGGGGGSYNIGTNQINTVGNIGNGQVVISWNTSPVVQTSGLPSGSVFPVGTTINTFSVTDASGNSSTCSFTVTVIDNELPSIACAPNQTQTNDPGVCNAYVTVISPTTGDNCGVLSVINNYNNTANASGTYPEGSTTVTWTVTDIHNNVSTCTQTITVTDNEAPIITCPANVTVNCQDDNTSGSTGTATAADNCTDVVSIVITQSQTSTQDPNPANAGHYNYVITRTWRATDVTGNFSECVQTINVQDVTAPGITCPENATVNCQDDNTSGATGVATGTDNCSSVTITQSDVSTQTASGPGHYNYTITRTWRATDVSGNYSECVQTINVQDVTAPVITCPANVTLNCQDDNTSTATGEANATDNCSAAEITQTQTSTQDPNPANVGHYNYVISRTWKATDVTGNYSECVQTITVRDITAPIALCKPITITLENGSGSITASDINNGSFDNCSPVTLSASKTNFSCSDIGNNTVTLTVTDVSGNSSTCTSIVTVVGEIPSCSITAIPGNNIYTGGIPTNLYLGYGPQTLTLQVAAPASGAPYTYAWSGGILSNYNTANPVFTAATAGSFTLTVLVTNKYGCTTTCSVTICVTDIRVPGSPANNPKVYVCHNGNTISVSTNSVATHLTGHAGDRLGKCNELPCTTSFSIVSVEENKVETVEEHSADFRVNVYPNPSAYDFNINISSKSNEPVTVRILDVNGRVRSVNTHYSKNNIIKVGSNLVAGTYTVEVIQGSNRQILKLVKLN